MCKVKKGRYNTVPTIVIDDLEDRARVGVFDHCGRVAIRLQPSSPRLSADHPSTSKSSASPAPRSSPCNVPIVWKPNKGLYNFPPSW